VVAHWVRGEEHEHVLHVFLVQADDLQLFQRQFREGMVGESTCSRF
jgi:hypothetical protein